MLFAQKWTPNMAACFSEKYGDHLRKSRALFTEKLIPKHHFLVHCALFAIHTGPPYRNMVACQELIEYMIDEWESMFGVDIEGGPVIGLVDISEREGVWFDMAQLNLEEPKKYKTQNLEVLDSWIDQIMQGTISLDDDDEPPPPPPPPAKGRKGKKEL